MPSDDSSLVTVELVSVRFTRQPSTTPRLYGMLITVNYLSVLHGCSGNTTTRMFRGEAEFDYLKVDKAGVYRSGYAL